MGTNVRRIETRKSFPRGAIFSCSFGGDGLYSPVFCSIDRLPTIRKVVMRRMTTGLKRMGQGLAGIVLLFAGANAQHIQPTDAAHLELALRKLNVLGSALYVGAHPDDENSAVIATLAEGRLVRTAYLSMTRGEGGQNLIGPEQGTLMGMIRTQELLAARRIDGGEQYFTRAIDFGYSKTSKETISFWGREKIVGDIVWVIRSFRPDVIMTRFSDTLGGHGNHLASAILTEEAFDKAGDPSQFPEQLRYVKPWKPKRIVFNVFRWGGGVAPTPNSVKLDVVLDRDNTGACSGSTLSQPKENKRPRISLTA